MKDFKKLFLSFPVYLMTILFLAGCVTDPGTVSNSLGCGDNQFFDPIKKTCIANASPDSTPIYTSPSTIPLVEDVTPSGAIDIFYNDGGGDIATDCDAINVQPAASISFTTPGDTCSCLGGVCQLTGFTLVANFNGVGQVQVNFTDEEGAGVYKTVPITVLNVDDLPVNTGSSVDLTDNAGNNSFVEDSEKTITLNYTDTDNDQASTVTINFSAHSRFLVPKNIDNTNCTFVSADVYTCNCVAGTCSMKMTPESNVHLSDGAGDVTDESFTYFVTTTGGSSTSSSVNYTIEPDNDVPVNTLTTFTMNEDTTGLGAENVTLTYTDAEGATATSCAVTLPATLTQSIACNCVAGVCQVGLEVTTANSQNTATNPGAYNFTYTITDDGLDDSYNDGDGNQTSPATTVVVTITPVNDSPTIDDTEGDFDLDLLTTTYNAEDEDVPFTTIPIVVDEGGASDENSQAVTITVTTSNSSIVARSGILIYYDSDDSGSAILPADEFLGDATTARIIDTADVVQADNVGAHQIFLRITPVAEAVGSVDLTVEVNDGTSTTQQTFTVVYNEYNDLPEINAMAARKCNFSTQAVVSNCSTSGCTATSTPDGVISTNVAGALFYVSTSRQCYYTNCLDADADGDCDGGAANNYWDQLPHNDCPISDGVAAGATNNTCPGAKCVGEGSPGENLITASAAGVYYLDANANKCYLSNASNAWQIYRSKKLCPFSVGQCSGADCKGTASPTTAGITPSAINLIFYDQTNDLCYRSTGTASSANWTLLEMLCRPSLASATTGCTGFSCLGSGSPAGVVTPTAAHQYFFDYTNGACYTSFNDGTFNNSDWVIYRGAIPDINVNENSTFVITDLGIDEGGFGTVEDTDELSIKITSSNTTLLPTGNINLFRGDQKLLRKSLTSNTYFDLNDGATSNAETYETLSLEVSPAGGQSGTATITLTLCDGTNGCDGTFNAANDDEMKTTFNVTVNPVGAIHGGWKNIFAKGQRQERGNTTDVATVTISWNAFTMAGSGTGSAATILGYNIFRRAYNADWDYSSPLNGSTLISTSALSYSDTTATPGKLYFYEVRPVDSVFRIATGTSASYQRIAIIVPPANKTFVHRWIVNNEVCTAMGGVVDPNNNYRCPYEGPGHVFIDANVNSNYTAGEATYYDLLHDLIVDSYEAGCPYTRPQDDTNGRCGINGCIDNGNPNSIAGYSAATAGLIYYDRSSGTCYRSNAATWIAFNAVNWTVSAPEEDFRRPDLPPIVLVNRATANTFCQEAPDANGTSGLDILGIAGNDDLGNTAGHVGDYLAQLPSRKEQVAMSAWSTTLTDAIINSYETGLSLSTASSKCNSTAASGVAANFTDDAFPISAFSYTLAGTASSGIRQLTTGATLTLNCSSRFGAQDLVGNVKEWASDLFTCSDGVVGQDYCFATSSDLRVNESAGTYTTYNLGGGADLIGPCDNDAAGSSDGCDGGLDTSLSSTKIEDAPSTYKADGFIYPVGLPAESDTSTGLGVNNIFLTIGSTPVNATNLHEDAWYFFTHHLGLAISSAASGMGLTYGGTADTADPISGDKAGRWSVEMTPITTTSDNLGFRCVAKARAFQCPYSIVDGDITEASCGSRRGCVGDGSPVGVLNPTEGAIYWDETNEHCYWHDGATNADWVLVQMNCPVTSNDSVNTVVEACDDTGTESGCVKNGPPVTAPTAIGRFMWDNTNRKCYISTGDSAAIEWQEVQK